MTSQQQTWQLMPGYHHTYRHIHFLLPAVHLGQEKWLPSARTCLPHPTAAIMGEGLLLTCTYFTKLQGALLANYSPTFIEQLRAASSPYRASSPYKSSSPYSFSTRGPRPPKRQLPFSAPFSQGSHSQCMLIWLKRTIKRAWPWGAGADYRHHRTLVGLLTASVLALGVVTDSKHSRMLIWLVYGRR